MAVGAYAALILFVGSRPGLRSPITFPMWDKVAHLCEYGVWGLFGYLALVRNGRRERWGPVAIFLAGLALGGVDEWIQSHTPGREPSVSDWLADAAGILLGIGLCGYIEWRRAARREEAGG